MSVKVILTISYLLVIMGSIGMMVFAVKFSFSTSIFQLKNTSERFLWFDGYQVWIYSWVLILVGTAGQLIAAWWPVLCAA